MDALARLGSIAQAYGGVLTRSQILAAGVRNRDLAALVASGTVARIGRGVYAVGQQLPDPHRLSASWLATISFESAVAWHGVDLPAPLEQIHLTVPRRRGRYAGAVDGVRLHRADVAPSDVMVVRGARVTSPIRTSIDIARHAPIDHAVAIIDAFLRAGRHSEAEFRAAARQAQGPGRLRIQTVAELVDPASGSVLESLTRMLLWRHGLPRPVTQLSLRNRRTGWVGYLDFAWPEHRVALECDGYAFHSSAEAFRRDRRRWSSVTLAAWKLLVVTWFDVTQNPSYVVHLVRQALEIGAQENTNVTQVAS
ncbi:MAG TPA: type IV toxin-antitoxin system AbiEi family antitoxin domain-containing protein [Mycobacteriales bacterium]|nr:type IV toxin-antitoxin system AbiEi family antitoxin domain-containing protein [Mycobacteriales bacterium]